MPPRRAPAPRAAARAPAPRAAPRVPRYNGGLARAVRRRGDVWVAKVRYNGNARPTRADVQTVANEIARRHPNAQLEVVTHSALLGWMTGEWFNAGGEAKIYDPRLWYDDPNMGLPYMQQFFGDEKIRGEAEAARVDMFDIFVREQPAGGDDKNNDCLFTALFRRLNGKLEHGPSNAAAMKKALGLARGDRVPIAMIPKVEALYKIAIQVAGDAEHESKYTGTTMYLTLLNDHYEYTPFVKRVPVLWKWNKGKADATIISSVTSDTTADHVPDPNEAMLVALGCTPTPPPEKKRAVKKTVVTKAIMFSILGKKWDFACLQAKREEGKRGMPLEKQWVKWMNERAALLEHGVDMFETPTPAAAALKELALAPNIIEWGKLPFDQQEWLYKAAMGALIWAENGFKGDAFQYDYNSFYPSLLEKHTFPKGPGKFMTVAGKSVAADGRSYWPYGIYRLAKPLPPCDKKARPLWRTHGEPYYTHYDLATYEKHTGLTVTLAQDGKANLLRWDPKQTAKGLVTFKPFVDKWYALKAMGVPGAKTILTSLWGALSQKHGKSREFEQGAFVPDELGREVSVKRVGQQERFEIVFRPDREIYQGLAPGVGCFLMSLARSKMADVLGSLEGVVRVATDSFTVTKPISTELTKEIGGLKLEHNGAVAISNVNSVQWS